MCFCCGQCVRQIEKDQQKSSSENLSFGFGPPSRCVFRSCRKRSIFIFVLDSIFCLFRRFSRFSRFYFEFHYSRKLFIGFSDSNSEMWSNVEAIVSRTHTHTQTDRMHSSQRNTIEKINK